MSDFPTLPLQSTIAGIVSRRAGSGTAVASGAITLQEGRVTAADITARTQQVWVNTGAGLVEQAVFVKGLGRYPDGSYRSLYIELDPGVSIPVWLEPTQYALPRHNSLPAAPTYGLAAEIRFGTVRGTVDRTQTYNTTMDGMVDPTTKLPPGAATVAAETWLRHPEIGGSTPAVIAATDPNYLSKCGFFGILATRQEAEAMTDLLDSGITAGQRAIADHKRFDYYLRDLWWGDASASNNNAFTQNHIGNTTGANWTGLDLSNAAPGLVTDLAGTGNPTNTAYSGSWTAGDFDPTDTTPPAYFAARYALGRVIPSGGHNYYDYAKIMYVEYARTGDLSYLFRGHATAWWYAWDARWAQYDLSNTSRNVKGPNWMAYFLHQPVGLGYCHLLTGDPYPRTVLRAVGEQAYQDPYFAQSSLQGASVGGEPRPVARVLEATRQLLLCTRPSVEGLTEVQGGETKDWKAEVQFKVGQIGTGTMVYNALAANDVGTFGVAGDENKRGPAPGWSDGRMASYGAAIYASVFSSLYASDHTVNDTVAHVGFNNFMQPMVCDALISCYDDGFLDATHKTYALNVVKLTSDFMYPGTFEGSPADNPHVLLVNGSGTLRGGLPSFKQGFGGSDMTPGADDPVTYPPASVALTGMYAPQFAWLARRLNDPAYKTIALRLLDATAKTTTQTVPISDSVTDGADWTEPYLIDGNPGTGPWKGAKEWMTFLPRVYEPARLVGGTGTPASDVVDHVRIYAAETVYFGEADAVGSDSFDAPASTTSYKLRSRTADQPLGGGRVVLPNRTYQASSSDDSLATASVVDDTLTVTRVSAGAATITVDDVTDAADHLALTTEPSASTVSGVAHAVQPAGLIEDASDATVTSDTSTVTATWVDEVGVSTPGGTTEIAADAGAWAFTDLKVTGAAGNEGHWDISRPGLATVSTRTITILSSGIAGGGTRVLRSLRLRTMAGR